MTENGGGPRPLTFTVHGTDERIVLTDWRALVAGYTGRDRTAVQAHIDELAAIGIPPPDSVPAFYPMDPALVTQDEAVEVTGANTSGEVEPVLVRHDGRLYLAVGSDHTDRDLEREDIARAKAICPKPVSHTVVPLGDSFDFDAIEASSIVDGAVYQSGRLSGLRDPVEVLASYEAGTGDGGGDLVMFGGTLPLVDGRFVPGASWELELRLPEGTRLRHSYTVRVRSTAAAETRR